MRLRRIVSVRIVKAGGLVACVQTLVSPETSVCTQARGLVFWLLKLYNVVLKRRNETYTIVYVSLLQYMHR